MLVRDFRYEISDITYLPFEKANKTDDSTWRKRFDDGGFKMDFFSSNNPKYHKIRPGYFICMDESDIHFVQSEVSLICIELCLNVFVQFLFADLNKVCGKSHIYIPKSANQMGKFSDEIAKNNLSHPIRIWTDYKRVNKTHFRSEVARSLWSFDIENESHTWGYWRMLGEKGTIPVPMDHLRLLIYFADKVQLEKSHKMIEDPISKIQCCAMLIKDF